MVLCKMNRAINSAFVEVQCEPICLFWLQFRVCFREIPPVLSVWGSSVRSWVLVYVALWPLWWQLPVCVFVASPFSEVLWQVTLISDTALHLKHFVGLEHEL